MGELLYILFIDAPWFILLFTWGLVAVFLYALIHVFILKASVSWPVPPRRWPGPMYYFEEEDD